MDPISIFISYSHEDEIYKTKLEKHLTTLKRNNTISTWNDRKILPGEEWDERIKLELENADVILLLVSVDFLNSSYCYDVEIKRAIERHEKGEAVVIPIILRHCDWKDTDLSKLQALPKNAAPIRNFEDEDEGYYSIIDGIKLSIKQLLERKKEKLTLKEHELSKKHQKNRQECDVPPITPHWVGRAREIVEIDRDLHKVVFISGIGGQGKSGLASHYIKEIATKKSVWEFWDWRDCQEKEDRIHTKIASIIVRLTGNKISASQLSDGTIDDLIELLFQELNERRIIFVFDNIDAYIEYENFQLIGAIEKLYRNALRKHHNSKFIFTCRSSINDIDLDLLSIKLQGLSKFDAQGLFSNYNLPFSPSEISQLAEKSFNLTGGHPLWLNLIAAQARRGLDIAENFIRGIAPNSSFLEESLSSMLSNKILNAIWVSLNDKQRTLLMACAENVRSETEETLGKILDSELNYNQFNKALKALKQLNLVVIKSMPNEQDTFELHPLVKEFVIQRFGRKERSKFITLFVNFYDTLICTLKPKISSDQPLSFFENWTAKIELAINKEDYKAALFALQEISDPICNAGYTEEYIRVATLLFNTIEWAVAINEEYTYFHIQFSEFITALTEFGKFENADFFLKKYEKLITNKGNHYIRFCKAKGHFLWFQGKFEEAIELTQQGVNLEENSETKSGLDLKHPLALSLRDTRNSDQINRALLIFLEGYSIDDILVHDLKLSGEIYGNIGRCLQFLEEIDKAIICYKKSLKYLSDPMNKGYAYLWYAECMIIKNNQDSAILFLIFAKNVWKKYSPIKAIEIEKRIESALNINPSLLSITKKTDREIEQICLQIISQ